jgi:Tol biopolymer transport system component
MPGANGRIAFERFFEDGEEFELSVWSINPDGSGAMQLTQGEDASEAVYSPDGSRLAFMRYDEIFVAAADGSGARPIYVGSTKQSASERWVANYEDPDTGTVYPWVKINEQREDRDTRSEPNFSPDGTALAVVHYSATRITEFVCSVNANNSPTCNGAYNGFLTDCVDCGSSIEAIDASTGALLATFAPKTAGVYLGDPSYSRGGAVAYVREPEESAEQQLLSVASPGAAPATLASGEEVSHPDFSPDGTRLVFTFGRHGIGIVSAAGGTPTVIEVPPPSPTATIWFTRSPVWSPDGTLIAFGNIGAPGGGGLERLSEGGIFLMRPDGSGQTLIQGEAARPSGWQPLALPAAPAPASAAAVRARAVKGKKKLRLSNKGLAVVGKVVCGSAACSLKATVAKLKVGKKRFGVKAIIPKSLLPGATAKLKVKVKGKAMAALKARRSGKLRMSVAVSDSSGKVTLPFAPKLLPPKQSKKPANKR